MFALLVSFFAQTTNAVAGTGADADASAQQPGIGMYLLYIPLFGAAMYFALFRPQALAKKKQDELLKGSRTGDKVVTSSGIHGVITNVKDNTVILRIADNVKIEIEKTHLDKITRADADSDKADKADKTAKA
jgi:preprotein translocase subunit YajC